MNQPDLVSLLLGLASAITWGAGDFSGGLATKRTNVYGVVLISQMIGIGLLILLSLAFAEQFPPLSDLLIGGGAGIIGAVGLVALYRALASSRMGLAAPVSAVITAIVPVIFALFTQGIPALHKLAGFGVALIAVWMVSRPQGEAITLGALALPALAGVCFGLTLIMIDRANEVSALWPLVAARVASISFMTIIAVTTRQRWRPGRSTAILPIFMAGVLDVGRNAFYSLAAQTGHLAEAAVLSSLYPAATVLLAWLLLKERLNRQQVIGVLAALVAIVLIAA
jgi:drug/metabolite transporter (DMT)-like permease